MCYNGNAIYLHLGGFMSDFIEEVLKDTIIDGVKLLPFLFVAFLIIELLEHKLNSKKIISKSGKLGPFIGSILGAFPQCGFSVLGTNLYSTRIITIGTLISIYLSTSDEMIPIMLSENIEISTILKIIGIKVIVGIMFGFIIDFIIRRKEEIKIKDCCEDEHCNCKDGILKSVCHHTISIFLFIFIASLVINTILFFLGEAFLQKIFLKDSILSPFISSLVGLIPNCASSVVITELYLSNAISFGSLISGLLTGAGVGILVLFRTNKNIKENILILLTIYGIGVLVGIIFDLIGVVI